MAKEIAGLIKLQIKGGAANPSPPVGPALGAKGVNIMQFCKQFNGRTQDQIGKVLPVIITVFADKSFDFIIKPHPVKVASVSWDQVKQIADGKMIDMNCFTVESAMRMIAGTARSMGITVKGASPFKN